METCEEQKATLIRISLLGHLGPDHQHHDGSWMGEPGPLAGVLTAIVAVAEAG